MVHEYELMFIARPDFDDADVSVLAEKFEATVTELGGNLLTREDWGKRRLAYAIDRYTRGHYILLSILLAPDQVAEVERRLRLDDRIIRYGVFKVGENVNIEETLALVEERKKAAEAAAARRAKEEEEAAAEEQDDDND